MRLYAYKLTTDVGQAPCVQDGLLTLAICKPRIRTSARIGDLIFGFAANYIMDPGGHATDNHLIYIARVDERISGREYYGGGEYAGRLDCCYEPVGEGFRWRAGARCHGPEHLARDLGDGPAYRQAVVLASRDFRYFGSAGSSDYKSQFPALKDAVERMVQGHLVNHGVALRRELIELKDQVWQTTEAGNAGIPDARPSAPAASGSCRRPAGRSPRCGGT